MIKNHYQHALVETWNDSLEHVMFIYGCVYHSTYKYSSSDVYVSIDIYGTYNCSHSCKNFYNTNIMYFCRLRCHTYYGQWEE